MKQKGMEKMDRFYGKIILITGAVGGLGSAQARVFAQEGGTVVLNYLDIGDMAQQADQMIQSLPAADGVQHASYAADITDPTQVDAMVEFVISRYGKLDVLINNAGISQNSMSWKYPEAMWDKVIAVNLTGAFHSIRAALPHMREKNYGRIINISSVVGITGSVGTVAYGASKAALIGIAKNIAREVSNKGITINCVAPGYIDAGIMSDVPDAYRQSTVLPGIPMGHLGEAEDVAKAVAFLGSDDAKYITGTVLPVDGGYSM